MAQSVDVDYVIYLRLSWYEHDYASARGKSAYVIYVVGKPTVARVVVT